MVADTVRFSLESVVIRFSDSVPFSSSASRIFRRSSVVPWLRLEKPSIPPATATQLKPPERVCVVCARLGCVVSAAGASTPMSAMYVRAPARSIAAVCSCVTLVWVWCVFGFLTRSLCWALYRVRYFLRIVRANTARVVHCSDPMAYENISSDTCK